jgi:hypothetical protein
LKFLRGYKRTISEGVNFFLNFRGGKRKILPVDENFQGVVNKFPKISEGGRINQSKISEGVYRNGTTSTGISEYPGFQSLQ